MQIKNEKTQGGHPLRAKKQNITEGNSQLLHCGVDKQIKV